MIKIKILIRLARPSQYLKNGFVLLPLIFGHQLFNLRALGSVLVAFAGFCFASSAVYVFNDFKDVEEDRVHPIKRLRPLASGMVSSREALCFSAGLCSGALGLGVILWDWYYLGILISYFLLNIVYSLGLKHIAVIDVVIISVGFVLRVFAGAVVTSIPPSHWLVLMTFLLAMFIGLAKRRDDLILAKSGNSSRKSLDGYNLEFVSGAMMVMASVTIVSYILYTVSPDVIQKHNSHYLYLTSFWVIIGLLRYMQITFVREKSGSPTQVFLQDFFLKVVVVMWLISFVFLIYVARF